MYLAPEIKENKEYCSKVDIYSLGLVILELMHDFNTEHERYMVLEHFKAHGQLETHLTH